MGNWPVPYSSRTRRPASGAACVPCVARWGPLRCRALHERRAPVREADEGMVMPLGPRDASRREFLSQVGLGACALTIAGAVFTADDYMEPKVLFEHPTEFKADKRYAFPGG